MQLPSPKLCRTASRLPLLFALLTLLTFAACKKQDSQPGTDKAILSFTLLTDNNTLIDTADITVTITNDSILVGASYSVDITALIPNIEYSGAGISPKSGVEQNFTNPITYTVTAQDGTTKQYIVVFSRIVSNSLVFSGASNGSFFAFSADNGTIKWQYKGTSSFSYASPTYDSNVVFAGCTNGYMYAFDALTGTIKWQFFTDGTGIESSPSVANGIVYFGSNDDNFYAVNKVTGSLIWKYHTGANVSSTPLIDNGVVYVGSSDNNLYALNAATGALIWTYATGAMINQSSPALDNGVVFIGSRDGYLHAVYTANGQAKWKYSTGGISLEMSNPKVYNGFVYIGGWYNTSDFSEAGSVYAINEQSGTLVWSSLNSVGFGSDPAIDNNSLFITGDDGNISALNATAGTILWQKNILPNGAGPTVSDGTVYVGGGGTGYFYALDATTGTVKWKTAVTNGLDMATPCVLGKTGQIHRGSDPVPAI